MRGGSFHEERYTAEEIAFALRQLESGMSVLEVRRKMEVADQTFQRRKKKFPGMGVPEIRRLKVLEEENRKLKQLVAGLTLDKQILQDVLRNRLQGLRSFGTMLGIFG